MLFWRRRHPIGDQELSAYVDGQLPSAARARLEEHIDACAACREALEELRALRGALRELPRAAAPRSFALREADVRPPVAPRPAGALGRAGPLLGGVTAAALVAFGALVGVDVGVLGTESSQEAADFAASAPEESQDLARRGFEGLPPVAEDEAAIETFGDTNKLGDNESATGGERSTADGAVPPPGALTPECPDCPDIAIIGGGLPLAQTPECPQCRNAAFSTGPAPGAATPECPDCPYAAFAAGLAPAQTPECPDCPYAAFAAGLAPAQTPECLPTMLCVAASGGFSATELAPAEPAPYDLSPLAPTPAGSAQAEAAVEDEAAREAEAVVEAEAEDGSRTPLRVAEGATAALALVAASSLALVWWRRRA